MRGRRVALIGHSAAGKSQALLMLGLDRQTSDMDCVLTRLGVRHSPPAEWAMDWLAADPEAPGIVVVSNHQVMLEGMQAAKAAGRLGDQFRAVRFVYLSKPREVLRQHLARPSAGGRTRPADAQAYTLEKYDHFDGVFRGLADDVIHCGELDADAVAVKVKAIAAQEGFTG